MAILRNSPWVTVTNLRRLLVGESQCEWAGWFNAHYRRDPDEYMPSDFDSVQYNIDHTAMLREVRQELEAEGYTVTSDGQNEFRLRGNSGAYLVGRPDFVAVKDTEGLVVDVKTGQPRDSDSAQVMLYMWATPRASVMYQGVRFAGRVSYRTHKVDIPSAAVGADFTSKFGVLMQIMIASEPAIRIPSSNECKYCNITRANCEERIDAEIEEAETSEF